jgi:nucleoside-diphosphate-sugar epimerase
VATEQKSAFVTGGSGFIGRHLLRRLVSDGWRVRALARSQGSADAVAALGAEPVRGDLDDVASMAAGAQGCAVAFHLAAHLGQWGSPEDFERGNVTGTRNALVACEQAGVRRFVHCGTEAALMAGEPLVNVDETAPRRPDSKALYSATKARAEEAVIAANREGFETLSMRPRFVWAADDTTLLPNILAMVKSGRFSWIDGGTHLTAITHVDNVVEGLVLPAERGTPGEIYFVTDGEPVVFREFLSELISAKGVEPPTRSVPGWIARAAAPLAETAWRVLPLKGEPPLTRFAYWVSAQECTIDISKARSELGYAPVVSKEQGLAELRESGAADRDR